MKWMARISLLILIYLAALDFLLTAEDENSPEFFVGGTSEIDSDDSQRAKKAIRKWSHPEAWIGDSAATENPYFWDYDVVGRPVFIRVVKNDNRKGFLEVWLESPETRKFEKFKTYAISYFSGDLGPKEEQGDGQAPEGFYFISRSGMNPTSSYHLSMDMGYPNAYDRYHERTGDYLMIHGKSVSIGCYAMTDASIEQIYTLVDAAFKNGQSIVRVHCFPFGMSRENLQSVTENDFYDFWSNLKEGWDWFEEHRRPPNVEVEEGKYVFSES